MNFHFIGIGGNGMVGVAKWALDAGFKVSGSDLKPSSNIDFLKSLGVKIFLKHDANNVNDSDVVIYSVGVPETNIELVQAKKMTIPVFTRMQALGIISNYLNKKMISVAGTHAKSTTAAMLYSVFSEYWDNTSLYVGAKLKEKFEPYKLSLKGEYSIVESCEYKGEFFNLSPHYCLLTAVDVNHEDYYGDKPSSISNAFQRFLSLNLRSNGFLVACIDSEIIRNSIIPYISANLFTYSLKESEADCYLLSSHYTNLGMKFKASCFGKPYSFELSCSGDHMVQNALGVITLSLKLGVPIRNIQKGLKSYVGASRRFDVRKSNGGIVIIDDNARIPAQVKATVSALKGTYENKKIIVIGGFWGKLNRRNLNQFCKALSNVDLVYLMPVGKAGQSFGGAEIDNADKELVALLTEAGIESYISNHENYKKLKRYISNNDFVICTMGYDSYISDFNELCTKLDNDKP